MLWLFKRISCVLLGHVQMYHAIVEVHGGNSYGGHHYCDRCGKTFGTWYLSGKPSPFLLERVIDPLALKHGYFYESSEPSKY